MASVLSFVVKLFGFWILDPFFVDPDFESVFKNETKALESCRVWRYMSDPPEL